MERVYNYYATCAMLYSNELEIEMANKYGFIVCIGGTVGNTYVGIESIL